MERNYEEEQFEDRDSETEDEQESFNLLDLQDKKLDSLQFKKDVYNQVGSHFANELSKIMQDNPGVHIWSTERGAGIVKHLEQKMAAIYQAQGLEGLQKFVDAFNKNLPKGSPITLRILDDNNGKEVRVNLHQGCKCQGCTMSIPKK